MKLINKIKYKVKKEKLRRDWRRLNRHNFTKMGTVSSEGYIDFVYNKGVVVGKNTYGVLNVHYTGAVSEKLYIGSNCSISGSANFLLGGEHEYKYISTYPYAYRIFGKENDVKSKGAIVVEDDVWIGDAVWIMSGVHIGKGAIIGTGAIVTRDVPPYAIVGGCPGKIIKYRFSENIIKKLMELDLTKIDLTEDKLVDLTTCITEDNVDEIISRLRGDR